MTNIMYQDKGVLLQLSATSINLNASIAQLYTAVLNYLELDERKSELAYYNSLVAAYSVENPEAESISELYMGISNESDDIRNDLKGKLYE